MMELYSLHDAVLYSLQDNSHSVTFLPIGHFVTFFSLIILPWSETYVLQIWIRYVHIYVHTFVTPERFK